MNGRRNLTQVLMITLSVSMIATSLTTVFITFYYGQMQFQLLGSVCQRLIKEQPQSKQLLLEILKEYKNRANLTDDNILSVVGYKQSDFMHAQYKYIILIAVLSFLFGGLLLLIVLWCEHRKKLLRINALTKYLERVNTGGQGLLLETSEDEFSILEDEIYKTVTTLYQTRDGALDAKKNYAENLANIAHQLKTPITAISLSVQMMKEHYSPEYSQRIQKQLMRLTHLEEALLLLSRIDAGTLALDQREVDVFTLLTLAADNLQEMFLQAGVSMDIPEMGIVEITADLNWTMEAIMNLFRNCIEHTPSGKFIHCSYEKNPLYVQLRIWDEGQGFAKEDIPHLFERFYRGHNVKDGGVGIGLSLAKAIIEMQNGLIRAYNIPEGGACFEIRFYSH